jgi:hypothetical protein
MSETLKMKTEANVSLPEVLHNGRMQLRNAAG